MNTTQTANNQIIDFFWIFLNQNGSGITTILAFGALIVSIYAINRTNKDNRKQVIVSKVEEIYDIILLLNAEYSKLYSAYKILEEANNVEFPTLVWPHYEEEFDKEILFLKKFTDVNELYNKNIRLNVLANAYLHGNLKKDVLCYFTLFESILNVIKYKNIDNKGKYFPKSLPTPKNVYKCLQNITSGLVKVISYGTDLKSIDDYFENNFKPRLGINE